jgi:hypothetical protein
VALTRIKTGCFDVQNDFAHYQSGLENHLCRFGIVAARARISRT